MSEPILEPWQQEIMDDNARACAELRDALKASGLFGLLSEEAQVKLELMAERQGTDGELR